MQFRPPLTEMRFLLEAAAGFDALRADGLAPEVEDDLLPLLLDQAGGFAAQALAPLNPVGDRHGTRFDNGAVTMPPGFRDAYAGFIAAGWAAAAGPPEFGGMGLPHGVSAMLTELWTAANMSFAMAPILNLGAAELLSAHGDQALKARYLPPLVSGEWTATMALTEPQAGSDLSDLRTVARPAEDGAYRLFGRKVFISYGEHDLTGNIVHLVLARLPDAPPGSRGISLFLAPKLLPDAGGAATVRNDLACTGVEHKLGIRASPTCSMSFGEAGQGALAWMVGEPNQGLACMFTMMNRARVGTALQGVGIAERATQAAYAFARDRVQGRAPGAARPGPIIDHPDVRRMLLDMRSGTLGARALAYCAAVAIDRAEREPDPGRRAAADLRAALLTPLAKAWCTQAGFDVASLAVQVYGGMGVIEEAGVAQYLRDARVAPIYEGSNGVQAIDLVSRKIVRDRGAGAAALLDELAQASAPDPRHAEAGRHLQAAVDAVRDLVGWLVQARRSERERLTAATPLLEAFAAAACGSLLLAAARQEHPLRPRDMAAVADHFARARLPGAAAAARTAREGAPADPDALAAYLD